MAILVTGGTGFIGSHTVVELLQSGYDVVIADNLYNSKAMVVDRIEAITGMRPRFYELDVCDKAALDALFDKEKIDAVIHFAGYKAVGESTQKPIEYYENNLGSTLCASQCASTDALRSSFHPQRPFTAIPRSFRSPRSARRGSRPILTARPNPCRRGS